MWTYCSTHRGNSNQGPVSTDFVHTGFLSNWNCHPVFSICTVKLWCKLCTMICEKKGKLGRMSVVGTQGKKQEQEYIGVLMRCDRCEMYYNRSHVDCQPQSLSNSWRRCRFPVCIITVMTVIIFSPINTGALATRKTAGVDVQHMHHINSRSASCNATVLWFLCLFDLQWIF